MNKGKISKEKVDKFLELVDQAETIAIASHVNPDGDNLGSSLGLRRSLELYGKNVEVIGFDTIDDYLLFLPEIDHYKKPSRDSYDLFMFLDCSEFTRIGEKLGPVAKASRKSLVLDHHVGGSLKTDLDIVLDTAPATCQIVFELLDRLKLPIDRDVASLLYTGLCTDTNRFLYSNVTEYTFYMAGRLLSLGAESQYIYRNLYQSKPMKVMKFETEIIQNAIFFDKKAYSVVSKELVEKHGVQMGDAENVISLLRDIDEVEVAMLLKEYDNGEYKVSLRSKDYDVSKIARANGGGGHIKASGFTIYAKCLDEAKNKAFDMLKEIDV